jgi:sigma-B regulation protein RsbU (phosphoserine phosphatase)
MTTFMDMNLEQRLGIIPAALTPAQRLWSWLSQGEGVTTQALDLPETPLAQGEHLIGGLRSMAQHYFRDLESSVRVQQELLPEQPGALPGADIAVRYLPMMGVSGDYYDFLPLREAQVGLATGDVCGKGMGAALLMASVCATLRAQVRAGTTAAGDLLAHLNRVVYRDTPKNQFVTLIYGIWDAIAHTFTYSSAGHPPVLHYQAATGRVRRLDVGGIVLGVCEETEYPAESVSLGIGDALVLYTDGVIEVSDASEEVFGIHRLSEVVAERGKESSEGLAAAILNAASRFACQRWEDDVTLVVIKRVDA